MSDSIIAQVRALANCNAYDYQGGHYDADGRRIPIPNWSALLAYLERTQAVCDAARALRKLGPRPGGSLRASIAAVEAAIVALDAALENLRSDNDGR